MAFVGISQNLLGDVRGKINNMCQAEIGTLGSNPFDTMTITGNESWFLDKVWGEHQALMAQFPSEWFPKRERISLHFNFQWDGTAANRMQYQHYRYLTVPTSLKLPPINHRTDDVYIAFRPDEVLPPELVGIKEHHSKMKEIELRWRGVQNKVIDFLESCKSLNEALKLWPDLRVYITKEYLDRVDKKAERNASSSKALDVLATIDTNEIQAAAVIARMSGAQV